MYMKHITHFPLFSFNLFRSIFPRPRRASGKMRRFRRRHYIRQRAAQEWEKIVCFFRFVFVCLNFFYYFILIPSAVYYMYGINVIIFLSICCWNSKQSASVCFLPPDTNTHTNTNTHANKRKDGNVYVSKKKHETLKSINEKKGKVSAITSFFVVVVSLRDNLESGGSVWLISTAIKSWNILWPWAEILQKLRI
jgi:hypothetical protein